MHINKHKPVKPAPANIAEVPFDHMPIEVANEILFSDAPLTNRMRKNLMAARTRIFASTLFPIDPSVRLARRLGESSFAQLSKWLRRTMARGFDLNAKMGISQRRLAALPEDAKGPRAILERAIAMINLRGSQMDSLREALEAAIASRRH